MRGAKAKSRASISVGQSYRALLDEFPLRPIRTGKDYDRAAAVIERLAVKGEEHLDQGEADYLYALALLVDDYDEKHHVIDGADLSPLDLLKYLMEQNGMSTADLGRLIGSSGLATDIMKGRRELSKRHIAILAERFRVDASLFLGSELAGRSDARRSA